MQILDQLRQRFAAALSLMFSERAADVTATQSASEADKVADFASMVRSTTDTRHGDYQANCAMPLAKMWGQNPRAVAEQLIARLQVDDLCLPPEIAGPGFINLKLSDTFLAVQARRLLSDERCGVTKTEAPKKIIVDFSSPNVAKPMHVGHIRSTVIGDSLAKVLRFLGHQVITDNHLGDWGTQFGMVIYGFRHFGDEAAFEAEPVSELSRIYRVVNRLIEYHGAVGSIDRAATDAAECQRILQVCRDAAASAKDRSADDAKAQKQADKSLQSAEKKAAVAQETLCKLQSTIDDVKHHVTLGEIADQHRGIAAAVLEETVKLHNGDQANLELWHRFLPYCKDEINRIYDRLHIEFDHTLGESFYHPMLADVVAKLQAEGLARDSEGAVCIFLPEFDAPMIVQKRDGAFLYATTDLATLIYRRDQFAPDEILYVVDTRQSEHFVKLFAVARKIGFESTHLQHINFGTVLGDDGRPFKTRSGGTMRLETLLDDAVAKAFAVVCDPERSAKLEPPLSEQEQREIADVVGHGAIKYADLSHYRASDYKFDLEKMVSLDGNTSVYIQYAYARTQGILTKGNTTEKEIISHPSEIKLNHPAERALVVQLLRFGESLAQVRNDYAPNFLVDYLYDTAKAYAVFNDNCSVLKAEAQSLIDSRLALVALTGRVLRKGLELLGIGVVARM